MEEREAETDLAQVSRLFRDGWDFTRLILFSFFPHRVINALKCWVTENYIEANEQDTIRGIESFVEGLPDSVKAREAGGLIRVLQNRVSKPQSVCLCGAAEGSDLVVVVFSLETGKCRWGPERSKDDAGEQRGRSTGQRSQKQDHQSDRYGSSGGRSSTHHPRRPAVFQDSTGRAPDEGLVGHVGSKEGSQHQGLHSLQ